MIGTSVMKEFGFGTAKLSNTQNISPATADELFEFV